MGTESGTHGPLPVQRVSGCQSGVCLVSVCDREQCEMGGARAAATRANEDRSTSVEFFPFFLPSVGASRPRTTRA